MYLTDEAAAVAAAQHGVLQRRTLLDLPGVSRHVVDGWLRSGVLERHSRGVYRVRGAPVTQRQQLLAAVCRAGAGAVAADETACALWQIEGFDLAPPFRVAVPPDRRVRGAAFQVSHTVVASADRTQVFGIPTMTVARALIGVARHSSDRRLRVAVDDARRRGLLTIDHLARRADDHIGLPGARRIRRLLAEGAFVHESEGERTLRWLFGPGDPMPEWQVWVLPHVRVDGVYLEARLALEYDSRAHHVLPTDRDADGARALELRLAGVEVISVTAGMLREQAALTRSRILAVRAQRLALGLPALIPAR